MPIIVGASEQQIEHSSTVRIVEVDAESDLVLVVGAEKQVRLKVNSYLLRKTSRVFKAMFRPNAFLEGQNLTQSGLKEQALPEDDPEAMEIICNVIHHNGSDIPQDLTPTTLLTVARHIDKYFLNEAFEFVAAKWFQCFRYDSDADLDYWNDEVHQQICQTLTAAVILRRSEAFNAITKALITRTTKSLLPMLDSAAPAILGKVACALEAKRSTLSERMARDLHMLQMPWALHFCNCSSHYAAFLAEQFRFKSVSITGMCAGDCASRLRLISGPAYCRAEGCMKERYSQRGIGEAEQRCERMKDLIKYLENIEGLDLADMM